jgi:hypothetical protein
MSSNDDAGLAAGQFWTSVEKFPTPTMDKWYLSGDGTAAKILPTDSSKYNY